MEALVFQVSRLIISMAIKRALYTLPVPSTDFTREPYYDGAGPRPTIHFGYKRNQIQFVGGIRFERVLCANLRAESCCTPWHIEGVYDKLVEIEDSGWVRDIVKDMVPNLRGKTPLHHYMIYMDSAGCFEVIAAAWETLAEEESELH